MGHAAKARAGATVEVYAVELQGLDRDRVELDRRELEIFGRMLEGPHRGLREVGGMSAGEFLAFALLKVRGKDGKVHPLRANGMQRAYEQRRGVGNIVLKARQMGMTTWVAGRLLLKTICRPGTLTLQVAHTQDSAEEILRIVHRFVDHLPAGLKDGLLKTGKSNVRQIVFPEIDSEFRVESAADRNAGRGMTFQNLHCSEVSRWGGKDVADAGEVLAGLRAGLAPGSEMVLESTPNGAGGCFYDEWQRADETGMVRHFFPWWMERGYRSLVPVEEGTLTEEERALVERLGLDLAQVGYRRELQSRYMGMARQEFAEDDAACFIASGEAYFDMDVVEERLRDLEETPPKWESETKQMILKYRGLLEMWMQPVPGHWYLVSVDPAGGGAHGDWSVAQVLDLNTGMQCAEYASHAGGLELMEAVRELAWDYNTAWLVVERNNHGSGLLSLLESKGYLRVFKGADGQDGFLTTSVSRPAMLAQMGAALVETPEIFRSKKLLVECRTFVRLSNGGVGARSGAHDDRVMAMAIGLAARREILGKTGIGTREQGTGNREQPKCRE